jgi:UDP-N-acetylmuramyl pentapeptide phosphotransferase/UDP-N-acetylglucosamine-1-phosphate transferase
MLAAVAVLSFVVAYGVLRVLLARFARVALDRPNERSLHERPVPRTGGIAILAGTLVSLAFGAGELWLPLAAAGALAMVSFVDDLQGMHGGARLVAHLAAAALAVWYLLSPMHLASVALLVIAIAWITNLFNFMDGSDGLAGGMAAIGFGAYAVAAGVSGDAALAALCTALAAASIAFLAYNFHPARVFLGDVGSIPLGFLAATLGLAGWRNDLWPLWFPVLVFGPFIGDATLTLAKRLARGERVWEAHRSHYYQRLVRMGFGHRRTALIGYAVMLACAVTALAGRTQPPPVQAMLFGAASALLAAVAVWVDLRWRRFLRVGGAPAGAAR